MSQGETLSLRLIMLSLLEKKNTKLMKCYVKTFLKMCAVPRMAVFCSSTLELSSECFLNDRGKLPVVPTIFICTYHLCPHITLALYVYGPCCCCYYY
jgi:hypothetical protein